MKKIIFITLAVFVGIGSYFLYSHSLKGRHLAFNFHQMAHQGISFDKWISFKPKGKSFTASFPLKPKAISKDFPIPGEEGSLKYHEYQCITDSGRLFSVSYMTLPDAFLKWGDNLILNGALKLIMRELGKVELVGKDSNTFKNYPALDYEHYTKEVETAGTLVLVGNTLYKVEVTYPLNEREGVRDELCNFVESFEPEEQNETTSSSLLQQHLASGKSQFQ